MILRQKGYSDVSATTIAEYEKLNSEENSGPETEVLYAWLGEAQFRQGKYEAALQSFKTSIERLGADCSNDDAVCGIMTDLVRMGDVHSKLCQLDKEEAPTGQPFPSRMNTSPCNA